MTSNLGARDIGKGKGLGFHSPDAQSSFDRMEEKVKEEIERAFNPEFLNRLDDSIIFHPLTREQIGEIIHNLLVDVEKRLGEEEIRLKLAPESIDFLIENGYDEKFGARPIRRAIQRYLEDPLSEKILLAEYAAGDEVEVTIGEDRQSLAFRVLSKESTTTTT
jgi:ATP-dependent Clp protease ATP-binding subunit ClpC